MSTKKRKSLELVHSNMLWGVICRKESKLVNVCYQVFFKSIMLTLSGNLENELKYILEREYEET